MNNLATFSFLWGAVGAAMAILCAFALQKLLRSNGACEYIPPQYRRRRNEILDQLSLPLTNGGMPLGILDESKADVKQNRTLSLSPFLRRQNPHVLVLGVGGTGKTRYLAELIKHDIESNDRAVVVLDSSGELFHLITRWMSCHESGGIFAKRTLVVDPDGDGPHLFYNPLNTVDESDRQAAAAAIVFTFKSLMDPPGAQSQWNAQTANILRNAVLLLMENNLALSDLVRLLTDNDFRDTLLDQTEIKSKELDRHKRPMVLCLLDTWAQYRRLAKTDQWIVWVEPILNRVGMLLVQLHAEFGRPENDIDFPDIINGKQILLVDASGGKSADSRSLLSAFLASGLAQAARSQRIEKSSNAQASVALYLDGGLESIAKETFELLTDETASCQIAVVAANRSLQHFSDACRDFLLESVRTICTFSLNEKDAALLSPRMFRVGSESMTFHRVQHLFNHSEQYWLISDAERQNFEKYVGNRIDRLIDQEERNFFCYRVGTQAGLFKLKTANCDAVDDTMVNHKMLTKILSNQKDTGLGGG